MFKGRRKIISEFKSDDLVDERNLIKLLNVSMQTHMLNKMEIDYLINYRNGSQTIKTKEKAIRDEINNKAVINHAQMITRNVIGYFLGTPIQYIQSGENSKNKIDVLNKYVQYEDKSSTDKEIGEYQSICGTAYRIIFTDGIYGDEVPFEDRALNPSTTYVVYENNVTDKPLVGVTYYDILNEDGAVAGTKIYAYTNFGLYSIYTKSNGSLIGDDADIDFVAYSVGGVPIVEYPNNMWRIGDWELCIDLMDAINSLQNGRLDDIDQIIQSLLVFINADIDEDVYDEMRAKGVVVLKSMQGLQSDVKTIDSKLDQSGMHLFAEELEALLYALIGIPDRNKRGGGGGDTGQAVELRDGWADLEVLARNKELVWKKAEKQTLRVILKILDNKHGLDLSLMDVDIKFTRNKNNNLMVKTQSYMNLLNTKTLSPADCLTIVDLVSDVNEYISRGRLFWGDSFAGLNDSKSSPNSEENKAVAVEDNEDKLDNEDKNQDE